MSKRPKWCQHKNCIYITSNQDKMCCGKLFKSAPHDEDFNTHRFCLDTRETGHGVFDLQVNRTDVWLLKRLMNFILDNISKENKINNCPKCGSEFVNSSSSFSLEISNVRCTDCNFMIQENIPEEDLIKKWNKLP
jgi:hypothetical protein